MQSVRSWTLETQAPAFILWWDLRTQPQQPPAPPRSATLQAAHQQQQAAPAPRSHLPQPPALRLQLLANSRQLAPQGSSPLLGRLLRGAQACHARTLLLRLPVCAASGEGPQGGSRSPLFVRSQWGRAAGGDSGSPLVGRRTGAGVSPSLPSTPWSRGSKPKHKCNQTPNLHPNHSSAHPCLLPTRTAGPFTLLLPNSTHRWPSCCPTARIAGPPAAQQHALLALLLPNSTHCWPSCCPTARTAGPPAAQQHALLALLCPTARTAGLPAAPPSRPPGPG